MNVEGITWHAIVLDPEPFAATKALITETFSLAPAMEAEGMGSCSPCRTGRCWS